MSVTTAFLHLGAFPFCAADIESIVNGNASYLDNLDLADVMAFAWNIETFELTTSGSADIGGNVADGDMTFEMNPMGSNVTTQAELNDECMWFPTVSGMTPYGSWPAIREPYERVCTGTQSVQGALLDLNADDGGSPVISQAEIGFWCGTDPINSGKYRLYYRLLMSAVDPTLGTTEIQWDNRSSVSGKTAFSNGTITLGALTFDWYSYYTTGATPSGTGDMTATSGSFTYP